MAWTTNYGGSHAQELKILKHFLNQKESVQTKNKLGLFTDSRKQSRHNAEHFIDTGFQAVSSVYILRHTGQE
jgi:hypothetical protein